MSTANTTSKRPASNSDGSIIYRSAMNPKIQRNFEVFIAERLIEPWIDDPFPDYDTEPACRDVPPNALWPGSCPSCPILVSLLTRIRSFRPVPMGVCPYRPRSDFLSVVTQWSSASRL